jgi:hypothetical protein
MTAPLVAGASSGAASAPVVGFGVLAVVLIAAFLLTDE